MDTITIKENNKKIGELKNEVEDFCFITKQ